MNPKFLGQAAYFAFITFGLFHTTKLSIALFTSFIMGRYGKPNLVRETSKIYTSNYLLLPYMYARKFYA
jgi:hypothetical protein